MRTTARTATTLIALSATALLLGACGDDEPTTGGAGGEAVDAGAAGTVEEDSASPGDADACALYLADGATLSSAYDEYGSGATSDPSGLLDALTALAGDIDAVDRDGVSEIVLGTAEEISQAAGEAGPALEGGAGVEELDATLSGLQTLADTCAEIGAA
ncbi:hypothetical protein [Blastococcus sp. SYSU D00695]